MLSPELRESILRHIEELAPLRELILANLVMVAQIPAPTGQEEERVAFMLDRFTEAGLSDVATDEIGNAVGILPGSEGVGCIEVVSHLDSIFPATLDHDVTLSTDRVVGRGVGDNALGGAVISCLPFILERLGITLRHDLMLLGATRSFGRGNLEGIKFHLDNLRRPVSYGLVVEGMQLGRLNHFTVGMLRGDVICNVHKENSPHYGSDSALVALNSIVNQLLAIEIPQRPYTKINLGHMDAGVGHSRIPTHGCLQFQVVSHDDDMIDRIEAQIQDMVDDMGARHGIETRLETFMRQRAGGLPFSHPLVKTALSIMELLDIEPDKGFSPSELSAFLSRGIPAVTLGITKGEKGFEQLRDHVLIADITRGVAQLIGMLRAIDEGACHVD